MQGNKTYEYDKRGNHIGISDRGRKIRDYEYDITGGLGLSYSKSGKARSYSYDGLGNRIGFKEYEKQIGYGEDGLKTILGGDKNAKFNYCDFDYIFMLYNAVYFLLCSR
nr:hypothetical protein [uncultured Lachnoanaerobaculum sp.]